MRHTNTKYRQPDMDGHCSLLITQHSPPLHDPSFRIHPRHVSTFPCSSFSVDHSRLPTGRHNHTPLHLLYTYQDNDRSYDDTDCRCSPLDIGHSERSRSTCCPYRCMEALHNKANIRRAMELANKQRFTMHTTHA